MSAEDKNDTYLLLFNEDVFITTASASHVSHLPNLNQSQSGSFRWIKNCSHATDNIDLEDPRVIGSLVPLGIICLVVIFGNIMVIAAVRMTRKMRGATNLFIVSLAWADLMLGMIVLPFSAMFEVFGVWIFGRIWCSIWLAIDVWTCTASILHLVVISLDRYIAVTHPITYPNIMTSNRAKLLICGAWILSFVICFPPLVGWKEETLEEDLQGLNKTMSDSLLRMPSDVTPNDNIQISKDDVQVILDRCYPKCELIQEPGYVIYSAVGSFYAPMLVMIFFNWRIYRTATKTTKAIRQGWTKVKGVGDESVGMGIHRGGGGIGGSSSNAYSGMSMYSSRNKNNATDTISAAAKSLGGSNSPSVKNSNHLRRHQTLSVDQGSKTLPRSTSANFNNARLTNGKPRKRRGSATPMTTTSSANKSEDEESSVPLLNGSPAGRHVATNSSPCGNSLMVPGASSSCSSMPKSPDKTHSRKKPKSSSSSSKGSNSKPNVSHHQPCPNHILGKTFAEQGTQTSKSDKEKAQLHEGQKSSSRSKKFLKWSKSRTTSAENGTEKKERMALRSSNRSQNSSPKSIRALNRKEAPQKKITCCPGLNKWRVHVVRKRTRRRSLGDGESDGEGPPSPSGTSKDDISVTGSNNLNRLAPMVNSQTQQATKFGKRNIKSQVRRFRMETKAAKTLGIIVGCFICCWFPFFTMYLITAFCEDCIPGLAFSVIFWLGYCNSAINPFIYAMFSRDFRNAFKKILCKFLCNRNQNEPGGALARMGLPFAPQTVAIGLADRFPPTTMVTNAAGVTRAGGHSSSGDNNSSITISSTRRKGSEHP